MLRTLTMCADPVLKLELMKVKDPTMQQLEAITEAYRVAAEGAATNQAQKKAWKAREAPGRGRQRSSSQAQAPSAGKCDRCARTDHVTAKCTLPKDFSCHACGKPNHIAPACRADAATKEAYRKANPRPQRRGRAAAVQEEPESPPEYTSDLDGQVERTSMIRMVREYDVS